MNRVKVLSICLLFLLAALDDADSRAAVLAERSLLAALEAGCTAPVGAYAVVTGDTLTLTGVPASTLKSRFAAALERLRRALEAQGHRPEEMSDEL